MTTKPLGVGIIGCGYISGIYRRNMPHFRGLALRACADLRPEAAAAAAVEHGIAAVTIDELLARDDIDLVVNLTVPTAHYAVSAAALAAGKHVFSEKPLAATHAEGRRLVEAAEAAGLALGCAPDTFLGGGGQLARALLDAGQVGRILVGTAAVLQHGMEHWHPDPEFFYQPGGGPVLDLGPYYLTALANLLGPVRRVQATGQIGNPERLFTAPGPRQGHRIRPTTPTTLSALLEYEAGAQITLVASWDVWKHGHAPIELYGTEGSMRLPDPDTFGGTVEITARDGAWQPHSADTMPFGERNWRNPNWKDERPPQANWRCLGLADLAASVLHGTPHRSSGRLALHVLEVMEAILTAAATGAPVTLTPGPERPMPLTREAALALRA